MRYGFGGGEGMSPIMGGGGALPRPVFAPGGGGSSMLRRSGYASYKKGGKVKKTGLAYMHKGEKVIPLSKLRSK